MAITTQIKNYSVAHDKDKGGGGGGRTYIVGNVSNSDLPDTININTINAANANIDYLTGKSMSFNDAQFIYLASDTGVISKLSGTDLNYMNGVISNLTSDTITAGKIKATEAEIDKAWIETLNSKNITTEYLTVTKQAHFFELVIDKIKSIGGTLIETAANCTADYVKAYDSSNNEVALDANNVASWGIFFRTSDGSGRTITNDWEVNDQAICQSFSNVSVGVNYDVSNKYYWMLVTEILTDRYMNLNTGAETNSSAQASVNSVQITNPTLTYTVYDNNNVPSDAYVTTGWTIQAQTIQGIITGAAWDDTTHTMTTTNTVFGIQMTNTSNVTPTKFSFDCTAARLNVGIYYIDSTSQWFPASDTAKTRYEIDLVADNSVEAIVITNADEVEWHQVHGIRLSNTVKDAGIAGYESIPSKGDHIAQLGYRYPNDPTDDQRARSSAIIIAAYKTPDSGIKPPSYAQYRNITDFNLASHRQTYFDAVGAQFIGDFLIDGTTTVKDYIDNNAPTYYMYTAYATNADYQNHTITSTTDPTGCNYMGIASSTDNNQAHLTFNDYSWFSITGATGANGNTTVFVYKNAATQPSTPTGQTYPPSGWAVTATTPPTGQYTWMSQSTKNGVSGQYGTWSTPVRITGDDGQDGTDGQPGQNGANGKYMEFIYKRFATEQTFTGQNNPANWAASQQQDYLGPSGYQWNDNPQGITNVYQYEYMSQREYDGTSFGTFTQPVIWSKWGEKGQDGDGYEYIYKHFVNEPTWGQNNNNPAYWAANQSNEYLGPSGYQWSDDPVGVDETYLYEYVSTRKRENGVWGQYSTPALWAHWSAPGSQGPAGPTGPQGPQGADGADAIQYVLLDQGSKASVITRLDTSNNMTQTFVANLKFKAIKIEGTTVTVMSYNDLINFNNGNDTTGMYAYVRYSSVTSSSEQPNYVYRRMTLTPEQTGNNTSNGVFTWTVTSTSSKVIEDNPFLTVALLKYNAGLNQQGQPNTIASTSRNMQYTCYTQNIQVNMEPNATLQILQGQNASISTLVAGQNGLSQEVSQIRQDQSSISSTVQSHTTQINNLTGQVQSQNTQISQIQQTADSISSTVTNLRNGSQNFFNFSYCTFENCVPFVQGYGIECKGSGEPSGRVRNLGFKGVGGDYSMTCYMMMQSTSCTVRVDINDTDMQYVQIPSHQWKLVQMTFHNVNITSDIPSTQEAYQNGFIDFYNESGQIKDGNRLYIRNLMIVKGNVPNDFNVSWKDYDKVKASSDVVVGPTDWTYDSKLTKNSNKYKGFDVYHIDAGSNSTGYYILNGNYKDLISANNLQIKNGVYTLSFYAKSYADTTLEYQSYMYYGSNKIVDGKLGLVDRTTSANSNDFDAKTSVGNMTDGQTNYSMQVGAWHRYIIHWYNSIEISYALRNVIVLRLANNSGSNNYNKAFDIAGIELREGYYDESMISTSSMIQQTADEITLKVNETGININDGTITLNADNTVIEGDLTLENDQGLKLYDSNKYERISITPESLGNLENYNFATPKTYTFQSYPSQTNSVEFSMLSIGSGAISVSPGQRIIIDSIKVYPYRDVQLNPVSPISGTSISYYYVVTAGSQTWRYPTSGKATATRLNTQYKYQLKDFNEIYTGTSNTSPYISIYITGTFQVNEWRAEIDFESQQSGLNKIAFDGAVFANDNTHYNWLGPDKTVIRRGNTSLQVNDTSILHNGFPIASYVSIRTIESQSSALTVTLDTTDEMILITATSQTATGKVLINLPAITDSNGLNGKIYYIKSTRRNGANNTYIKGNIIQESANSGTTNEIQIGNHAYFAIGAGKSWLLFKCG